jgi:hypothetical protein
LPHHLLRQRNPETVLVHGVLSSPSPWKRLYRSMLFVIALLGLGALGIAALLREVGGASSRSPADLKAGLSKQAAALVQTAWQGITPARLMDYHTHLVGLGVGGTGCSPSTTTTTATAP